MNGSSLIGNGNTKRYQLKKVLSTNFEGGFIIPKLIRYAILVYASGYVNRIRYRSYTHVCI